MRKIITFPIHISNGKALNFDMTTLFFLMSLRLYPAKKKADKAEMGTRLASLVLELRITWPFHSLEGSTASSD